MPVEEIKKRMIDTSRNLYNRLALGARKELVEGINKDLDSDLKYLREYIQGYNKKVEFVRTLISDMNIENFNNLTQHVRNELKYIVTIEFNEEMKEEQGTLKSINTIRKLIENEDVNEYSTDEKGVYKELKLLSNDLKALKPFIEEQLRFLSMPVEEQKRRIKDLMYSIKSEGSVIGSEELDLKDLKLAIEQIEEEALIEEIEDV